MATRRPLSRRAGTMQAPRCIVTLMRSRNLPTSRCGLPRTGLDRYPAHAGQTAANMPVPMPAMRLSPRRRRPYISGRHGRAPDCSPGGRAATAALCTRAVRCDLKRRAARGAAWATAAAAQNWKVVPDSCKKTHCMHSSSVSDVLRGDAETGRKLHNRLGKMPPRVCRQTAIHARLGRTNP